jgi:hypothetical protein
VYGIDERRFNNIDTRFGFDALVGPKTGALDFTIQTFNDTPLTNFLLQTPLGHWLLPLSYINVASVNNYDAQGFVNRVLAETDGPSPCSWRSTFCRATSLHHAPCPLALSRQQQLSRAACRRPGRGGPADCRTVERPGEGRTTGRRAGRHPVRSRRGPGEPEPSRTWGRAARTSPTAMAWT